MTSLRLWGILVIALALRAALMWPAFVFPHEDRREGMTADSGEYLRLAGTLLARKSYDGPTDYLDHGEPGAKIIDTRIPPEIFRAPGYPALLAGEALASDLATGPHEYGSYLWFRLDVRRVSVGFQVLIDIHLVLLTFFLGRRLAGNGTGLLAALFQAISPVAIASSCRILSDGVFAFLLIAGLLLMLRHFRTGGWWPLLTAAVVMGLAVYVRPVGMAMAGVMALVLLFRAKRVRRTAAFAGVVMLLLSPWVIRNAMVADYVGFSAFATDSMYWYSAAETVAREKQVPAEQVRNDLRREEGWDISKSFFAQNNIRAISRSAPPDAPCYRTPGGLASYRWQRAREIILAHPWMYLGIHLKGCTAFWLPGATDVLEIAGLTSGGKGTLDVLHRQGLWAAVRHYFGDNTKAMWLAGAILLVPLVRYAGVLMLLFGKLRLPWRRRKGRKTRRRGDAGTRGLPAEASAKAGRGQDMGNGDWLRNGALLAVSVPVPVSQAGRRPGMGAEVWLCLLLVLVAFLLPGPAAHPRFRVPVEPILSVAAAAGWALLAARWRARRGGGQTDRAAQAPHPASDDSMAAGT